MIHPVAVAITIGMRKAPATGSQSQTVFPLRPVHLGQAILRVEAVSPLRPGFFRSRNTPPPRVLAAIIANQR